MSPRKLFARVEQGVRVNSEEKCLQTRKIRVTQEIKQIRRQVRNENTCKSTLRECKPKFLRWVLKFLNFSADSTRISASMRANMNKIRTKWLFPRLFSESSVIKSSRNADKLKLCVPRGVIKPFAFFLFSAGVEKKWFERRKS